MEGKYPPRKLCRGGTFNPTRVDIFIMHHEEYRRRIYGHREASPVNILSLLSFVKSKSLTPHIRTLSVMRVKKADLGLQNPVTSGDEKYLSSRRAST